MHPYDASKSCADLIALTYANTFGFPVCVTRCGNFFGGGDMNWNRIVPGTIRSVLRGERPVIRSDGSNIRDYFYVKDGAEAYLHLAECMARQSEIHGHAFNLSTESQVSALGMVERILGLMQSDMKPKICNEAHHEIRHQYLSAAKARGMLAWSPRYELDEALRETIVWYRDFFAAAGTSESASALRVA
jgi:CDP-glucose 4,6-dehydratase